MKIRSLIVISVLAIALLFSGGAVNAQTTDTEALIAQLQAQIAQLLAQIQALQAQSGTTSQEWCHTFNRNLGYLNSGSVEVGYLHTALDKEGISYAPDSGNTYGPATAGAVAKFQRDNGISPARGYFGALTRRKLNSLHGCNISTPLAQPAVPQRLDQPQEATETPSQSLATTTCNVWDVGYEFSRLVSGTYYYNLVIKVKVGDLSSQNNYKITGVSSNVNSKIFTVSSENTYGNTELTTSTVFSKNEISSILNRKKSIAITDLSGNQLCAPMKEISTIETLINNIQPLIPMAGYEYYFNLGGMSTMGSGLSGERSFIYNGTETVGGLMCSVKFGSNKCDYYRKDGYIGGDRLGFFNSDMATAKQICLDGGFDDVITFSKTSWYWSVDNLSWKPADFWKWNGVNYEIISRVNNRNQKGHMIGVLGCYKSVNLEKRILLNPEQKTPLARILFNSQVFIVPSLDHRKSFYETTVTKPLLIIDSLIEGEEIKIKDISGRIVSGNNNFELCSSNNSTARGAYLGFFNASNQLISEFKLSQFINGIKVPAGAKKLKGYVKGGGNGYCYQNNSYRYCGVKHLDYEGCYATVEKMEITTPEPTPQPSITVTSPNGGETWRVGETKIITWNTSNVSSPNDKITLYVALANNLGMHCNVANWIPNTGSYNFTVGDPSTYCGMATNNTSYRAGNQFKILACVKSQSGIDNCDIARDYSDNYFTISSATTTTCNSQRQCVVGGGGKSCSINNDCIVTQAVINSLSPTIASPGSSVTIYGSNLLYANTVVLYLSSNRNIATQINAAAVSNDGTQETFVIPQNMVPGVYAVTVWDQGSQISSNEAIIRITSTTQQINYCNLLYQKLLDRNVFGKTCSQVGYDATADIDKDGKVSYSDLAYYAPNRTNQIYCQQKLENTTNPCATTQPSIRDITSPGNRTNEFYPGDTLTIWGANFTPSGTVWIGSTAVNYQGSGGGLISVTVPFSLPSGIYNLYVTGQAVQNTNTVQVSILSYSTQPSITVTSPNGGETWRVGETKTITWNTSGYDSNAKVRISLFDNFNPSISWLPVNPEWQAGTGIPNTGVYSWVVPATIANPGGNNEQIPITGVHRIFITISGNVNGILYGSQDYSDNYFTISATTANCTRNPSMCQGESSCYRGNCVANNRINIVCNPGQKIGDVDGDGQILENDATLNANIAVRNIASPSNICCADTTQNGTLSGLDSSYIGQMVSGIITSPGVCATNPANG